MARLFTRQRGAGGGILVHLNELGRSLVLDTAQRVAAAERGEEPAWAALLASPVDPSRADDPIVTLGRQRDMASNAELVVLTVAEDHLSDAEAWAWLSTLQVALRGLADEHAVTDDDALSAAPPDVRERVQSLQTLLFALASCL